MANTISLMSNVIRNVVSKKRIRYKENGFNLDLTYICENIIAMGYPAPDKFEGLYRNRYEDVFKFLEENHGQHYKIYNLCLERNYDINKFNGRVAIYPFEDHNPPTIELIERFCKDVDAWLKQDNLNVVAVHCKAGKGRTGTMICAYLLYSGMQKTADEALAWYDEKRTKDGKGVTIPSQRRYVQYFSNLICSRVPYKKISLNVCEIRFAETSFLRNKGTVQCSVYVLQDSIIEKANPLETWQIDFQKSCILAPSLTVAGDIKFELKKEKKIICHFWFNTFFVQNSAVCQTFGNSEKYEFTLKKSEIDDAHKDRAFSEDFKVSIVFETAGKSFEGIPNETAKKISKENNFVVSSSSRFPEASATFDMMEDGDGDGGTESHMIVDQQIKNLELDETLTNNQNDGVSTHSKNPSTAFKRKKPSTKSILLTANNTISKNDIKKLHIVNQPSAKSANSGFVKWQNDANITPKTRDLNDSSGNILKYVGESIKSLDQDPYITCSKRSSPHANHNTGEGDEDWESGESSSVVSNNHLATKVILFNLPCSHSNITLNEQTKCNNQRQITTLRENPTKNTTTTTHTNPNPNRLENDKLANEKFLSNIQDNQQEQQQQQQYDHDHDHDHLKIPLMIQNSYKDVHNQKNGRKLTLPQPFMKAKMMPSCIKKFKKNKTKLTTANQNLQRLQNYFRSDSTNICRNFITYRRNTFAGRKSKPDLTPNTTIIPISSSFSSSSSALSSSSMSSSSSSSSSSRGAAKTTHSTSCPIIYNSTTISSMKTIEKSKSTSALTPLLLAVEGAGEEGETTTTRHHNVAKNNSDDYYSNICDNLLSLNNSPCKSSRLLIAGTSSSLENRHKTLTTTTTNHSNSNVIIVCTKPAETISIGFNTETQINCLQENSHKNEKQQQPYTFPDLHRVVDNINMEQQNTRQHTIIPPDLFYSVDFNNTYRRNDYEIKSNQTPKNLDILGLDEDKSKDISSNVNVTTNYAEN